MISKLNAALLLLFFCLAVKADVVEPGHLNKQFSFSNLDKFPGYKFYYLHHGYHYDRGYKPNAPDTVEVVNGQRYYVSEKGDHQETLLIKDKSGRYFRSDIKFGGATVVSPTTSQVVENFELISIKNRKVKSKKTKEIQVANDGKETEMKKGLFGLAFSISNDQFTSGLTIAAMCALIAMIAVFIFRRRKPKYIQLAS